MKNLMFLFALVFSLTIISCGSDDGPEVTINAPVDGNSYKQNTSFDLDLSLTDADGLSSLTISNTELGLNVLETFQGDIAIDYTLTIDVGNVQTDKYEIIIEVTDTDGNVEDEKLEIEIVE